MSQYVAGGDASVPIESYDQLVGYFEDACKPRAQWRIGTEYEKVAVRRRDGRALSFTGGIETVLRRLADRFGWEPIEESGRVVALGGARSAITLEPGGQLELSGEVCDSTFCARAEFETHVREILTVTEDMDVAFLGLGMQPISRPDEIEFVPKRRYAIMAPYMRRVGTLGHRMMAQTATVQVNIDYGDEADAMRKLRVGTGISPILTAMFANSPMSDGALNGFASYRAHIWTDTDNDRCGMLPFVFVERAGFADYVEYALDVPMYFIVRNGASIEMTTYTFRRFWKEGYGAERATLDDWNVHLTTLFPEFRMKRYIEVRSCDSQPPETMLAVPALVKGIFYDRDCLDAAWDLVKKLSWSERLELYYAVPRDALRARCRNAAVRDLALELLDIARVGLQRQAEAVQHPGGEDEASFLEPLRSWIERGQCPADRFLERWLGEWRQDIPTMVAGMAYREPS